MKKVKQLKPTSNAIILYNKRLLLLLRDNIPSIPNPNKWSLIGGVIEDGETKEQAMLREMKEEIGVIPKSLKYLGKLFTSDKNLQYIYIAKMTKDEVKNIKLGDEGQEVKFFSVSEIERLRLANNLQVYFKKHRDYFKKWINSDSQIEPKKLSLL